MDYVRNKNKQRQSKCMHWAFKTGMTVAQVKISLTQLD